MENLTTLLLKKTGIYFLGGKQLHLHLQTHNDYPSLKSLTDTLDYFGITNIAANVPLDALSQLPKQFLTLVKDDEEKNLVLVEKVKNKIHVIREDGKIEKLNQDSFLKIWTGTIIAVEKEENIVTQVDHKYNIKNIALGVLLVIAIFALVLSPFTSLEIGYILTSFIGLVISYLIMLQSFGVKSGISDRVCNIISPSESSCTAVISSSVGKIGNKFGLADASIVFFMTLIIAIVLIGISWSTLLCISITSLFAISYSIYLQAYKIKAWCSLCLLISVILLLQFGLLSYGFSGWEFSLVYNTQLLFIAGLITAMWVIFKSFKEYGTELDAVKNDLFSFKRNTNFFFSVLHKNKQLVLDDLPSEHRLVFGNPKAVITLTSITNPFCGFCKEPFLEYDKLLKRHPEDIQLQVLFNVVSDPEAIVNKIATRIINLYQVDKVLAYEALLTWFKTTDWDAWSKQFPDIANAAVNTAEILASQISISKENGINYTPVTVVNRHLFPKKQYKISDLPFFITDFKEQNELTTTLKAV